MNNPIDIVVTWVDQKDLVGQKEYDKYKTLELQTNQQSETNQQAFNPARYRDGEIFRFGFRAVEKNCPGINKIFLVVANSRQVPSGLNRDNPKLRIVYHSEYMPKDLLPTFNIMPIEMYYYNIPDLSENFITSNDDFFFLNPCTEDMFFENNRCVQRIIPLSKRFFADVGTGLKIRNNNIRFLEQKLQKPASFVASHLFEPRQKSFEKHIMEMYGNEIHKSFLYSKFRHPKNYLSGLFIDYMKITGPHVIRDSYKNSKAVELSSRLDINSCKNLQMCCFNDTEKTDNFEGIKAKLKNFLFEKFPSKSSFELNDIDAGEIKQKFLREMEKENSRDRPSGTIDYWLSLGN